MRTLLLALLLASCATTTKYKKDTCFDLSFMSELPLIMRIYEVTEEHYKVVLVHSMLQHNREIDHKFFEKGIEENGIAGQSCKKLIHRRFK